MTQTEDPRLARAHAVDIYVGSRVRERRKALGISQGALADHVGLTFQQVQKYERGSNRISASKLYEISQLLHVPAGWFFSDFGVTTEQETDQTENELTTFLKSRDGAILGEAYLNIRSTTQRVRLMELMRSLGQDPMASAALENRL